MDGALPLGDSCLGSSLALLSALHIKPSHPEMPIPEHVVMALTVLAVGTVLALLLRSRLSVERPGPSQQIAELLLTNPDLDEGLYALLRAAKPRCACRRPI